MQETLRRGKLVRFQPYPPGADVKQIERQRQEAHHNVLPNLNARSEP